MYNNHRKFTNEHRFKQFVKVKVIILQECHHCYLIVTVALSQRSTGMTSSPRRSPLNGKNMSIFIDCDDIMTLI